MPTKSKPQRKKLKSNVRLHSLLPAFNTKVRRELLDADYLPSLSKEDLEWYAQFIDESVGGAVNKTKAGKVMAGYLHDTPELAKKCYDDNNRRNRDVFGVSKANGQLLNIDWKIGVDGEGDGWYVKNARLTEDALIADLDREDTEKVLTFKEYIMVRQHMKADIKEQYDLHFANENPYSYLLYFIYETKKLTESQLDRLLKNPKLFDKIIQNSEFMKRKKN